MLKRVLASVLVAGLVTVATPGVSQAAVKSTPSPGLPSFNKVVWTVTHSGPTVYVGGDFTRVTDSDGTVYERNGAAAFDRKTGEVLKWNPNVDGEVRVLRVAKQGIFLGGDFDSVKGKPRQNFARVAAGGGGRVAPKFNPSVNRPVQAITLSKGRIFFGGSFSRVNGKERIKLAAVTRKAPFKLTGWRPKARDGVVKDIVRTKRGVYVAGAFRKLNNTRAYQRLVLVRQDKAGKLVKKFKPNTRRAIFDIAVTKKRVYAAVGGRGGGAISVGAKRGGLDWERRFDGDAQAILPLKGVVYVGGHFDNVCDPGGRQVGGVCNTGSTARSRGAAFNSADGVLARWNPQGNGGYGINAFDRYAAAERLLAVGDFSRLGGTTDVRGFAMFESRN